MNIVRCSLDTVRAMCEAHHGYASAGGVAVYAWAVMEGARPVAAFSWQPPPIGAAKSVCPEAPHGVLALSRMVAVPKAERTLRHISKPLRLQMRKLIDRSRWPVLITYSDEGQGHTGHVYKCSGWEPTKRSAADTYEDEAGSRASRYSNGKTNPNARGLSRTGTTTLQRWEHWCCERGAALDHMEAAGWQKTPTGRTWRNGTPAFRVTRGALVLPL